MSTSAFGIDHGLVSKKEYDKYNGHGAPSAGRRVMASVGGGYHPLIAGKKGKKARAYGNQAGRAVGGSVAGGVLGSAVGYAAGRGKNPISTAVGGALGGAAGAEAGIQRGVTINQRKGYLKKEQ